MSTLRERASRAHAALHAADPADRITSIEDVKACLAFVLAVTGEEMRARVRLAVAEHIEEGSVQHDIADAILALLTGGPENQQ